MEVTSAHPATRSAAAPPRQLTAVLFVDIVGATTLAVELGDEQWARRLEQYHAVVRSTLERHGGSLMDTAGDGFFAIFDDAEDAVTAALDVRASAQTLGLELRSGIHLGHCWTVDDKCAGTDVHVGARLASSALPGEVLVSEEVAAIVGHDQFDYADQRHVRLKGLPGSWKILAVERQG